jgi:precorrin-6Y C5,15-methyltransferase (decarboxylating)
VANAVTLEAQGLLLSLFARHGGDLTKIAVSRAEPVGRLTGWRPAMEVMQWSLGKP